VTTIRVYEPALCCNTGVCGPDVDEALVAFTADLKHLQALGVDIERHNLANDPQAFASNETVRAFLQVAGSGGLPLTLVDGVTVATGSYPDRARLLRFAGVTDTATDDTATDGTATDGTATDDTTAGETAPVVPTGAATLVMATPASESCCGGSDCC
jgi:hypothetical protein